MRSGRLIDTLGRLGTSTWAEVLRVEPSPGSAHRFLCANLLLERYFAPGHLRPLGALLADASREAVCRHVATLLHNELTSPSTTAEALMGAVCAVRELELWKSVFFRGSDGLVSLAMVSLQVPSWTGFLPEHVDAQTELWCECMREHPEYFEASGALCMRISRMLSRQLADGTYRGTFATPFLRCYFSFFAFSFIGMMSSNDMFGGADWQSWVNALQSERQREGVPSAVALYPSVTIESSRGDEPDYTCPITLESCAEPVVASDGHTYERMAIVRHMLAPGQTLSPMTRERLEYAVGVIR